MPGAKVSTHITREEYSCRYCGAFPPVFLSTDGVIGEEYAMLFRCFEHIRKALGNKPITITRGYTCPQHELEIYFDLMRKKYDVDFVLHTAEVIKKERNITPFSVHIFGLALDLDAPGKMGDKIVKAARTFNPAPRIGWKMYQGNESPHVHVDFGFLILPSFSPSLRSAVEW